MGSYHLRELFRGNGLLALAFAVAGVVGFLASILSPYMLAMATAAPAFVILFLTNLRITLLALLVVRSNIDVMQGMGIASAGSVDLNAAALLGLALVGLGAYYSLANRVNLFRSPVATIYAVFLAVCFAGLIMSAYPMQTLSDWLRAVSVFAFYVLMVEAFRSREDISKIVLAYFISSVVPVAMGLYQLASGNGVHVDGFDRVYGTFVVPPVFAFYLVGLMPMALVALMHARNRLIKGMLAVWLALMAVNLFATYTRGAWIGAAIALVVLGLWRYRKLLIVMCLLALVVLAVFPQATERFADLRAERSESGYGEANTLAWRTKFWVDTVLANSRGSPLVGAGLGSIRRTYYVDPHNDYLRLLVETGALGLAAYASVLTLLFIKAARAYRVAASAFERDLSLAFMAVLLAYATMSVADNIILGPALQWYFWTQAAIVHIIVQSTGDGFEGIARKQVPLPIRRH